MGWAPYKAVKNLSWSLPRSRLAKSRGSPPWKNDVIDGISEEVLEGLEAQGGLADAVINMGQRKARAGGDDRVDTHGREFEEWRPSRPEIPREVVHSLNCV